jgi:hypothetical protein
VVAVLRAHPNPPQAAQAPRATEGTVRNLASVAAVIALAFCGDERDDEADDGAAKVLSVGSICDEYSNSNGLC